jgi:hypothetical protein
MEGSTAAVGQCQSYSSLTHVYKRL